MAKEKFSKKHYEQLLGEKGHWHQERDQFIQRELDHNKREIELTKQILNLKELDNQRLESIRDLNGLNYEKDQLVQQAKNHYESKRKLAQQKAGSMLGIFNEK
jgi:hypothetical protein